MADMTNPPANPSKVMTSDMPAALQGVNGVAHSGAAAEQVAESTPPQSPSRVFVRADQGDDLVFPAGLSPNVLQDVTRLHHENKIK